MTATMIKFVCSGCGERLSVPDRYAGRKGACPNCRSINRVPHRGFSEDKTAAPVSPASDTPAIARASGNGHSNGNGHGVTTVAPPLSDGRGHIEPPVMPIEPASSRVRSLIDPPADQAMAREPIREPANGNGAYVHPLLEALAAPVTDGSDPVEPVARSKIPADASNPTAPRAHGVLAPDELTPGERWRRAWEEPRPGLARKILASLLPHRSAATASRPGGRTLDDGFSLPLKVGMLLAGVAALVGMIYLVLYFLLWSHLNM